MTQSNGVFELGPVGHDYLPLGLFLAALRHDLETRLVKAIQIFKVIFSSKNYPKMSTISGIKYQDAYDRFSQFDETSETWRELNLVELIFHKETPFFNSDLVNPRSAYIAKIFQLLSELSKEQLVLRALPADVLETLMSLHQVEEEKDEEK